MRQARRGLPDGINWTAKRLLRPYLCFPEHSTYPAFRDQPVNRIT